MNCRDKSYQLAYQPTKGNRSIISVSKASPALFFLLLGLTTGGLGSVNFATSAVAQTTATSNEGYILLNRGWVNDAIAAFQRILRSNPNALEARLGLAIAYQKAGQDSAAWNAYQQVLNQDPNNRTALKAIGVLGGYRPEWQPDGITALTALLQLNPNDTEARAQRALLYGYQGRFAKSLADYQPLLQSNPKPEVLLGAAQIYTYSGNYSQGIVLFKGYQAAKQSIPDNAVAAYATALRQTGQVEQAIQLLEARLQPRKQLDTIAIQWQSTLAVAYQLNKQPQQASALLSALRSQPEATLALARASSEIARQSSNTSLYQEAIALYRQVLQKTSNPPPGLVVEVADVMRESAPHRAEALQLYQQAIQQQPDHAPLKIKQLILAQQIGQISRTDLQQQLLALLRPLPAVPVERQFLAQALLPLDPPDPQLLSIYQELAQSDIDVPFLAIRIAQILIQTKELEEAKQVLATYRATAVGSQDPASELFLAEIERRENKLDNAAQRYESIIARNPSEPVLMDSFRGLAGIRQAQGRVDEALQIYDQIVSRNPQATWAQLGKTSLAYQTKRLSTEAAETALNQWLQTQPTETTPELFSLVGALPPDPKRESLYNTLLSINPDSFVIQRRLIQVLAMRDPQQARSQVNQLLQRDPTNLNAYFVKGEFAQTLGNFNEAAAAYQEILQRQPENVDALLALGGVRFQQQRYSDAETIYKRIVVLKPTDSEVHRILAELSLAQDQPQAAMQQLKQAEQIQKTQGSVASVVADRLERVQVDHLRRRGFQPSWERY